MRDFKNGVAHNAYIQILHDQGLLGLFAFYDGDSALHYAEHKKSLPIRRRCWHCLRFSMSLSFYVFKPYLNIMMMCAMSF
ncbi:MAG: hypothetical protein L6V93_09425 [Clostridiales bacterium]|nr:MAG: hypothetical protein L6V93_09425 [Clostridiales bacterium]